ncbi:MAG: carbohydrate ABC transporter permease [Alphaproteobacteria bacterium]
MASHGSQLTRSRVRDAWLYLTPMLIVLAAVAGYPLFMTILYGFTDARLSTAFTWNFNWVGLDNYLEYVDYGDGTGDYFGLLNDPTWINAVWNTIKFTVISVSLETVLGMAVALTLHAHFRGRGLLRTAILIPWAIPTIVSAKMWAWMLHDQFGIINDLLMGLGVIASPIAWTASPDTAMAAVIIVDVWKTTPFMALLILAGLQMLPGDIYEAAKVDGVHPVKVFFRVTLPLVRPALMVAIIFRALDSLRIFDLIYVLTPNNSQTRSMSVFAQENLFQFDKFHYGSAASTFLFLVIAMLVISFIKFGRMRLGN